MDKFLSISRNTYNKMSDYKKDKNPPTIHDLFYEFYSQKYIHVLPRQNL